MKKQFLILVLSVMGLYKTQAQYYPTTASSGSTIETSTGNVGIGIVAPPSNLTIQGFGDPTTVAEIIGTNVTSLGPHLQVIRFQRLVILKQTASLFIMYIADTAIRALMTKRSLL